MGNLFIMAGEAAVDGAVFDLETIMTNAVNSVKSEIFVTLGVVVPALVAVIGAVAAVGFGIHWLRKMGKG